ncbi:hypothetical protein ILUMI_21929 [Ignelater luminosus]|uniref:Structure-specific endonuclease subunit SLX4 n=1 Tax=Ignelater luminosus TaxID=2038154 RepID=A0A8K0CFB8_IGNLU|nr:hypothetical protein ILUMI_21929 [Ignelater luminosus]
MKPQNHSQRSSSFSRLRLNSKNNANASQNSSKNPETISKHCTPTNCESNSTVNLNISEEITDYQCSTDAESPYKSSLTEIKHINVNTSANEEKDFKTPKQILHKNNKLRKNITKKQVKKSKRSVQPGQMILTKSVIRDSNDVNQEHLELALALSRSLVENHKIENEENNGSESEYPSTQQKLANVKQTLLQFKHESNTTKVEVSHHRTPVQTKKKTRKSKFQYITPVLYLRTQEDREKLISEKVTLILSENEQKSMCFSNSNLFQSRKPDSEILQKQWNRENKIFKANNFSVTDFQNNDVFYVKALQISESTIKCGHLLRNWNEIPGREKSPVHDTHFDIDDDRREQCLSNLKASQENYEDTRKPTSELHNLSSTPSPVKIIESNVQIRSFNNYCLSPDLFESDEEMQFKTKQSPVNKMSPIIKRSLETHLVNRLSVSDDSDSESLLGTFTPIKRSLNKKVNSPKINESKSRHWNSSSTSDEIFTNEKGICSYESFFDLTHSSDEETNTVDVNTKTDIRSNLASLSNEICLVKSVLDDSLKNDDTIITTPSTSKTGVSDILQNSLCLNEGTSKSEVTRRSKSLNITEYIHDMLNNSQEIFDLNHENLEKVESIDLTQSSSSSSNHSQSPSKLLDINNKKDDSKKECKSNFQRYESFKSTTSDDLTSSQCSQESICIDDEELNYSCMFQNSNADGSSKNRFELSDGEYETDYVQDTTPKMIKKTSSSRLNNVTSDDKIYEPDLEINSLSLQELACEKNYISPTKSKRLLFNNLLDDSLNAVVKNANTKDSEVKLSNSELQNDIKLNESNNTPKREMIIKTANITPMTNYDEMNTPKINKELNKFGLKPLKRQRGVQILKHIYETTHPLVNNQNPERSESDEDKHRVVKKRKSNTKVSVSPKKHKDKTAASNDSTISTNMLQTEERIEIVGDLMAEDETIEDLIFERKQSTKVLSCRVPLHIAWHNLLAAQPELRENMLLYEPLQLEILYKTLKEQGYKYHIEDLLTFLDKKCITIRTNQNQGRNKRNKKRKSTSPKKSR